MKILYLDCTNGVSGDMLLKAVSRLSGIEEDIYRAIESTALDAHSHSHHNHSSIHDKNNRHGENGCRSENARHGENGCYGENGSHIEGLDHGRSHEHVKSLIHGSGFSDKAKATAANIYEHIARAEAKVHEATPETVHFHEVGRDEAIKNALAIGMAMEAISPDKVLVSDVYDGKGKILCSHGEINVPVPAVMALRERCDYVFKTADVDTEMVTPSGLAALMGIGAEADIKEDYVKNALLKKENIVLETEAKGSRQTGRPGLKAYILEI